MQLLKCACNHGAIMIHHTIITSKYGMLDILLLFKIYIKPRLADVLRNANTKSSSPAALSLSSCLC